MPDLVTLRHATEFERRPGGAESTVAAGVARLGHGAGWMSRLGRDEFGAYVLGLMRSEGVDTAAVRVDPHARTGVFFRGQPRGRPVVRDLLPEALRIRGFRAGRPG